MVAGDWAGAGGIGGIGGGIGCVGAGVVAAGGVAGKGIGNIIDGDADGDVVAGDDSVVNAPTGLQALRVSALTALTFQ